MNPRQFILLSPKRSAVANGSFSTNDFSGWTLDPATTGASVSSGQATATSGGATNRLIYQTIALVPGKTYRVLATRISGALGVYIGTAPGNTTYGGLGSLAAASVDYAFTASSTSAVLTIVTGDVLTTATFDNVSCR